MSKKHHMHTSLLALIARLGDACLPVRPPQFQSLCLTDLEFPTQAMLNKIGVSDILVCHLLLNKAAF